MPTADDETPLSASEGWPRALVAAAAICGLEALAVVVLGAIELAALSSDRLVLGLTTAVFFVVYAVGLAAAARGLARHRSWSRAPLLLAQLIQVGLAWSFVGGATTAVAVALAVPALAVAVVLLAPATTEILYGDPDS